MLTFATAPPSDAGSKKPPLKERFKTNIKDKECRRYFWVVLVGKMLGLATVGAADLRLHELLRRSRRGHHHRSDGDDPTDKLSNNTQIQINAINTTWIVGHRLPGVLHAGRVHVPRGRLRPVP